MADSILEESLPPAPPVPAAPKTPPPPPPVVVKPAPVTHAHNIISSTSIAKKVTQCLEELFPEPPPPSRGRTRTTSTSGPAPKKIKPQIIITLTAKSVSAPKAITICEILKRRIAERGLYWYQYCALEEVLEEVKPKPVEPKAAPQRDTTRRSSWGGPPTLASPPRSTSRMQTRSPLHTPAKPPKMGSLTGPSGSAPTRPLVNASTNSQARTPSRLLQQSRSAKSLKRQVESQPTVDEEDPFGPLSPPPKRAQEEPPVKRVMPVLTIYLSTQRIDDYKELHGEQSNEPSPYTVPLPGEKKKKK
ncbi:hypothetical protein BGX38DRAFT_1177359 [Terfezia claveryi]|nr:hypothetical protein BGX38DRAFT_1177359 [Terfezia claveryi]